MPHYHLVEYRRPMKASLWDGAFPEIGKVMYQRIDMDALIVSIEGEMVTGEIANFVKTQQAGWQAVRSTCTEHRCSDLVF